MFVDFYLKPDGIVPFTVNMKQEQRESTTQTAYVSYVELVLYGNTYKLLKGRRLLVNENPYSLPYADSYSVFVIAADSDRITLTTNFGLEIAFLNEEDARITLSQKYRTFICGICGNMDGLDGTFFKFYLILIVEMISL
jgi:hypothetical protein